MRRVYNDGMDLDEFRDTLKADHAPRALAAPLRALWHDARGDWKRAHEIVQAERGKATERVHAYLHRKEGDLANADYWYSRAGAERPRGRLETEWEELVRQFLGEAE
jgi:hypothetical protein